MPSLGGFVFGEQVQVVAEFGVGYADGPGGGGLEAGFIEVGGLRLGGRGRDGLELRQHSLAALGFTMTPQLQQAIAATQTLSPSELLELLTVVVEQLRAPQAIPNIQKTGDR